MAETDETRARIVSMHDAGYSDRAISRELGGRPGRDRVRTILNEENARRYDAPAAAAAAANGLAAARDRTAARAVALQELLDEATAAAAPIAQRLAIMREQTKVDLAHARISEQNDHALHRRAAAAAIPAGAAPPPLAVEADTA